MKVDINNKEFRDLILRSRSREIHELSQQRYWGHTIVYGAAGIGKTTLLELFRTMNPVAYSNITFCVGTK